MSGKGGKTYGLIIRKKQSSVPLKLSIFGNDSSSDDEKKGPRTVNNTIKKEAEKKKLTRQNQNEMVKVLEEDPTAYDYDKIYDEMAENKASLVAAKKDTADKKPKYIGNLLKFAEVRKKEEERRVERQVQKEREAEGNEFEDKDAFVTSAYRNKMQEMADDEERQKKLDELEGDVTKQADLSMFYRNLLDKDVSKVGAHDTEDQSTIDKSNRVADDIATSSLKGKDDKNKSSEMVKRSKHDVRREDDDRKDDDDRTKGKKERKKERKRERESHDKREGHRKVSDKSKSSRESDDQQQRKHTPETKTRREKREKQDEENTALCESRGGKDGQGLSKDDGGQDLKNEQKPERKVSDTEGTSTRTDLEQEFNEDKNDRRKTNNENDERKLASDVQKDKPDGSKFAKHSSKDTVLSARERYLARKNARIIVKPSSDDDD